MSKPPTHAEFQKPIEDFLWLDQPSTSTNLAEFKPSNPLWRCTASEEHGLSKDPCQCSCHFFSKQQITVMQQMAKYNQSTASMAFMISNEQISAAGSLLACESQLPRPDTSIPHSHEQPISPEHIPNIKLALHKPVRSYLHQSGLICLKPFTMLVMPARQCP